MLGNTELSGELAVGGFVPFLAEQLRLHDVGAPFPALSETRDEQVEEFAETLRKWWPYVRPKFRPLVAAWVAVIECAMAIPLAPKAITTLRGMMRRDIAAQTKALWDADKAVMKEWVSFNPKWVNQIIAERVALDPMLLMPPVELAAAKKSHKTASDTDRKRALRGRKLAQKLYDYLRSHGGSVEWCDVELSRVLSSKNGGRRLKPEKISDAASALVSIDAARWIKDRDGNKVLLQLVDQRLMLPAPDALH